MSRFQPLLPTAAVALVLLAASAAGPVHAQGGARDDGAPGSVAADAPGPLAVPGFADEISVGWVLVPVLVRDRSGRFITDLGEPDFALAVDGEPVAIASFERGREAPLSLVVLQDLSGSMANGGKLDAGRRALTYLLTQAHDSDELAVATFAGGRLRVDVPFTNDRDAVSEAMNQWYAYGTTALHDAVAWIPDIGGEGRHPKRAVLLVTDGIDNASTIAPDQARRIVEQAHLPVYVVGLGTGRRAGPSDAAAPEADTYARLLRQLARVSGGRYYEADGPKDVARAVRETLEHLRHEYVLGFPSSAGTAAFRRIQVLVDGGKHQALHRLGYTGGPPEDEPAASPSR